MLNEEAGEVKEEAPSKPLQPLAGVNGYEGLNYDHIYNTFQLQEAIAERDQKKGVFGYSGKVVTADPHPSCLPTVSTHTPRVFLSPPRRPSSAGF